MIKKKKKILRGTPEIALLFIFISTVKIYGRDAAGAPLILGFYLQRKERGFAKKINFMVM